MSVDAVVTSTGEVLSYPTDTPEQIIESYLLVNEYIKCLSETIKPKLQKLAASIIERDPTYEHNGYKPVCQVIQRMNYDKAVLREILDPDTFDLMLEPAKKRVDEYIKENLEQLGPDSTRIRESMIPTGNPYTVIKLERLTR